MSQRVSFDSAEISIDGGPYLSSVTLSDGQLRGAPGSPLLPAVSVAFVIPAGARVVSVVAVPSNGYSSHMAGIIRPAPVLLPLSGSVSQMERGVDESIYRSTDPWPEDVMIWSHTGNLCGFTVVSCLIQPFSYIPSSGELRLYDSVDLQITWDPGSAGTITDAQYSRAVWRLTQLVDNTSDIVSCSPVVRGESQGDVEYLVICDSIFSAEFEPLVSLQEELGRTALILETHEVLAGYPGSDEPEQLRNCLIDYWQNMGTVFVLLAGDEVTLPTRFINTECEGWVDYFPVDHYFSDLDGTWDGNGDGDYGQPDDDLDLYMDVLLGRVPCSTSEDAATFVEKTLVISTSPPPGDWYREAVLCGAVLFEDIGYVGAKGCDSIAAALPASWDIVKAYEVLGGDWIDTHIAYISDGSGWTHYASHGNERGVYWDAESKAMMTTWLADTTLWNGDRLGVHTAIGCHPGGYHIDECLAEVLLNLEDRGAVSVMFNTGYGWEGFWPELGPSEWLCIDLARQVFREKAPSIGLAFASAKDLRVPWMHGGYDRTFQSLLAWTAFQDPSLEVRGVPENYPVPPAPLFLSAPYPNPVTRDAPVAFQVSFSESPIEVSVHDLAGRLLWESSTGTGSRVVWGCTGTDGRRVPAGVYIVSARCGQSASSRKLTVLD